jgi:hypothetical protein
LNLATPLNLNDLLVASGIAPETVLVLRHRPYEPKLNRVFDWLVAERPDLFDCYQSTHARNTESALMRADWVASFIRHRPGLALFAGLYERAGHRLISVTECLARPAHQELVTLGMSGEFSAADRTQLVEFELRRSEWRSNWIGRLIIRWPGLERSWYRWADRNIFEVEAITEENVLVAKAPAWHDLVLSWRELAALPESWRAILGQWRGIYLIIDELDGRQYVGSASGHENLLQRWHEYSRTGHGGNRLLRGRNPATFRFSILQLLAPDADRSDVAALEASWKHRLRTRSPNGLNEN